MPRTCATPAMRPSTSWKVLRLRASCASLSAGSAW
jgi:hypothetical protein